MAIKIDLCHVTDQHFGSFNVIYSREISGEKVCYFAAHSSFWEYPDYLFYYLEKITSAGFELIFISSSRIGDISRQKLSAHCQVLIEKENKGADFGAWKVALSLTGYGKGFASILLANDSVLGPFSDLRPIFQQFCSGGSDFYGLTRSLQRDEHIQSYFVLVSERVLISETWLDFWDNLLCYPNKEEIVDKYEIYLTKKLRAAGFQYGIWSDWQCQATEERIREKIFKNGTLFQSWGSAFKRFGQEFIVHINPSAFYWLELITDLHFPFLKRELIVYSKLNTEYDVLKNWKDPIAATGYQTDLISQVFSLAEMSAILKSYPFNNPDFAFHYAYDPASPHFTNFILSFREKTCLEQGANACLTITDIRSGDTLKFNFIHLSEKDIDGLIRNDGSVTLHPGEQKNGYNLLLPFSDAVIPYLQSLSHPRTAIIRRYDEYECATLRFIQQVVPHSGNWENSYSPAGIKNLIDISDLKDIVTLSNDPARRPGERADHEPQSFFELINWYHREYESLPMWYKKIGQLFKISMGHKIIHLQFRKRSFTILLKHKVTVPETNKAEYIRNWYHHEYDVLPEWYKRFGKMINKNK